MDEDTYRATAAAYDLLTGDYIDAQLSALDRLVPTVDPVNGPVLDIGCGSGRQMAHVAERVSGVQVLGLEPSEAMRALAIARLATHPALQERVTVRPEPILRAPLPGSLMLGVFGHFDEHARNELLCRLARRLPAGGGILFDLQHPEEPAEVPRFVFAETRLGSLRYRGLGEASPVGGDASLLPSTSR